MKLTEEQKQEIVINFNKIKEQVTTGLMNNSNILVESKPGLGKNTLVQEAVEKAGLRSLTIELSEHETDFNSKLSAEERRTKWERRVLNLITDEKSTALVINASPKHDIGGFAEIAKKLNIPMILVVTTDSELKTEVFSNVNDLLTTFDKDSHDLLVKELTLQRINQIKSATDSEGTTKKLSM